MSGTIVNSGTTSIGPSGAIVDETIETSGVYDITADGAQGGSGSGLSGSTGGLGAQVVGEFSLTAGDTIELLVGGKGSAAVSGGAGGGGGGTFVYDLTTGTLLEAAGGGGGGGGASNEPGVGGLATTSGGAGVGGGAGGASGSGGVAGGANGGAGGGGYSGTGTAPTGITAGASFQSGGQAGTSGGFGGGGGGEKQNGGGGGGGGYSGGGGGGTTGGGGGGGSFVASTAIEMTETADVQKNNGTIVFGVVALDPTITGTVAAQPTSHDAAVKPFQSVTIADPNTGTLTDTLTIALSGGGGTLSGTGITPGAAGTYTISGTVATINTDLDSAVFSPAAPTSGTTATTTFALTDSSSAGATSATDRTTTVTDTDPAAPTITGTKAGQSTTHDATLDPFSSVTITDTNAGYRDTLTITLSGGGGTLSGTGVTHVAGGTYTLSGTAATITKNLDGAVFTPNPPTSGGTATTTFSLTDVGAAGTISTTSVTDSTTTVTDTDPAPSITGTVTGQATTYESVLQPFKSVTITDPNAGSPTDTLSITLSGGGGSLSGTGVSLGASGTYTIMGSAATITSELDSARFTPTAPTSGTMATTTFALSDKSSGGGTSLTDTTTTVTDTDPVAPTITGTAAGQTTTNEAALQPFHGVTITDLNAGTPTDTLMITLSGGGGTLTGTGITATSVGTYTISASTTTINNDLHGVEFTPAAPMSGTTATTTFALVDTSSAGATSATNSTTTVVDTHPVAAPTIAGTAAGQATTHEATLQPFHNVTITDTNIGGPTDTLTIILSGGGGTLSGTGVTLVAVGTYTLSGTAATINADLQNYVTFKPNPPTSGTTATTTFALTDSSSAGATSPTDTTTTVIDTACYGPDTRIVTERGEVAIRELMIGERVLTASGGRRPVVWLGHRVLDTTSHPAPRAVWPVLVREGAFADTAPRRDLWLSPGHNVVVDGALMPISLLCNGRTIEQVRRAQVEYWHVELDAHDIILADGLPAESYLDTGNRGGFANGGAFIEAHPDFKPRHWKETCLPLLEFGPELVAAKRALLARAAVLGHVVAVTDVDGLHILADGQRIEPLRLGRRRAAFTLPAGCARIALKSRRFIPAHHNPASNDTRVLGVQVARLQLDDVDVRMDDNAVFGAGWHRFEPDNAARWTDGGTELPAGTRLVVVDLLGDGHYWAERADNLVALFG